MPKTRTIEETISDQFNGFREQESTKKNILILEIEKFLDEQKPVLEFITIENGEYRIKASNNIQFLKYVHPMLLSFFKTKKNCQEEGYITLDHLCAEHQITKGTLLKKLNDYQVENKNQRLVHIYDGQIVYKKEIAEKIIKEIIGENEP